MTAVALFAAVFLACVVEAVEATTIVVAVGATRSWRSALTGAAVAVVVLAAAVALVGPAILLLPLAVLRLVVGGLLLVFGLGWLRKAVLRAAGRRALRDEEAAFRRQVEAAESARRESRFGVSDWYAFTVSFKGVLLEGLEVVFIVLTFATNQGRLPVAVVAALAAIVLVVALGAAVRGPLSRVPENALKFVVGIMLTAFGLFWGAEGAGAHWPGDDAALLAIAPAVAAYCLLLVVAFSGRRPGRGRAQSFRVTGAPHGGQGASDASAPQPAASVSPASPASAPAAPPAALAPQRGRLAAFGLFWYDFVVGDDWRVAAGVAVMLALIAVLAGRPGAWLIAVVGALVLIPYGTARAAR